MGTSSAALSAWRRRSRKFGLTYGGCCSVTTCQMRVVRVFGLEWTAHARDGDVMFRWKHKPDWGYDCCCDFNTIMKADGWSGHMVQSGYLATAGLYLKVNGDFVVCVCVFGHVWFGVFVTNSCSVLDTGVKSVRLFWGGLLCWALNKAPGVCVCNRWKWTDVVAECI